MQKFSFVISLFLLGSASTLALPLAADPPTQQQVKKNADAPYLKLPATKSARPGRYFFLKPDTNCQSIKWLVPAGLDQLSPEIQLKDPNVIGLIGDAGTYTVSCYGALNGQASDLASCTVTIGTPPPPTPPTPPTPPAPTDPLVQALQTAYNADTDANKAGEAATLAALFTQASTATVNDASLATLADLLSVMQKASANVMPATALTNTRKAVAAYLNAQLGTTSAPLDATLRSKASTAFAAVGKALTEIK